MVVYCWVILFSRNKFIFKDKRIDPKISTAKAESILEAYHGVRQTRTTHIDNPRKETQQKWIPPPKDVFKINVDATNSRPDQKVRLAALITDLEGKAVAVGINQSHLKESVSIAEDEAIE